QIALDEELALRLQAEEQAELEKERVAQEEASRAITIKELDIIQAMIDTDVQLAARLQAKEQEKFSIEEKSRILVEMTAERKKFLHHKEQQSKEEGVMKKFRSSLTKHTNSFVPMDLEVVKSSVTRTEGSSKRAGDELESDKSKKQKIDEHVEAKTDDQEEVEMKSHIEIVKDDEVAIDAIPLATKPPLIVEERLARQKEEEAKIALIESWDNTQAMMDVDFELAQRLQAEEQGEITIEERSRLFIEIMNKRKKQFEMLRAEEIRRKPPTKAQKRNQMSSYLNNMAGYKHSQLKSKSYDEIQKLFDKEMKR
ncbi:hypothetical protein Tco_0732626, partial [Tanacetum coccineum]